LEISEVFRRESVFSVENAEDAAEGKFSDYFLEMPHSLILLSKVL